MVGFDRAEGIQEEMGTAAMPPSPRIKKSNARLLKSLLRTAFSGRVGGTGDASRGSDRNEYRRGGKPQIGSRDCVRTAYSPSRGGRWGHRAIDPGAHKGRRGCEQAVHVQLHSVGRSGEFTGFGHIRGNRDLVLNGLIGKKPCLPAAVVPPRIQLDRPHRRPVDAYADSTRHGLARIRTRKLDGL